MSTTQQLTAAERLLRPAEQSMSPEIARWLVGLRADDELQLRVDELADKNTEGVISPEEYAELENYVALADILATFQAQAARVLEQTNGH